MLRLSTRGRYGVRAMYEIARAYPNPVTTKHISERQALSVPYLEQILNRLKNAGLLVSIKGPGGGYVLSRKPEEISIIEILKELDGPPAIASCLDPKKGCIRVEVCVTHIVWKMLSEQIEGFLRKITLADLLKFGEKIGVGRYVDA
ncbi:MAG: RrF2 family transcriptional regulator [Archaeoglobaceae archaeon]